jgi:DNA-binding transcriptional ArsR family regulator
VRKDDVWAALGDPSRREILARVIRRPGSVTDIARELPISRPAVSQHLHVLLEARFVDVQPRGRQRIYEARLEGFETLRREVDDFWSQALATFKRVAEESHRPTEE